MIAPLVALARPLRPTHLLAQNSPNPFSEFSFIAYELREPANVDLKLADMNGKEVQTLVSGMQDAGRYVVTLDGEKLKPGRYTYVLSANGFSDTKSMEVSR